MVPKLKKILCVEDEMDIQTIAKVALEAVGNFTVQMCGSGQGALDVLKEFSPDLILLDVMMPGMDGPTTYGSIRKMNDFENVPIVFMTAKVMETDQKLYRSLGAAGIIAKPFDPMTLSSQIEEIWAEHHERR